MRVRDGMSKVVLTVGPGHTLRDAARLMAERRVGAAVVLDPDSPGPGIITERDLLEALGGGQDMDDERVSEHLTSDIVFAAPDWSVRISFANLENHVYDDIGRATRAIARGYRAAYEADQAKNGKSNGAAAKKKAPRAKKR